MSATARGPVIDGLMAATAKVRKLVFVSCHVTDVARAGITVLNPWEQSKA